MKRIVLCILGLCAASPAFAVDKIYRPYVNKGELELEYFAHSSFDDDGTKNHAQAHELSLAYGVNRWWKTEIYGIWEKEPGENTDFDAVEWENLFQLTDKGEYWVDVGATLSYEWTPDAGNADAIEGRLIFAKNYGKTFHVLNLALEKEVGEGPRDGLEGALLWSSRYRYSPYFEPGFELQSEFGELDDLGKFDDQEHYIGPMIYGKIPLEMEDDAMEGLQYRAGYLFGVSHNANDGEAILQLEYELEF